MASRRKPGCNVGLVEVEAIQKRRKEEREVKMMAPLIRYRITCPQLQTRLDVNLSSFSLS